MGRESHFVGGLLLLFILANAAIGAPVLWDTAVGGNGHLYDAIYVPCGITWTAANNAAQAMPGDWHLATVTSAAENAFIYSLIEDRWELWCRCGCGPSLGPWLGGYDANTWPNYDWTWVTGEPFGYTNWALNKPLGSGDAIAYYSGQPYWTNWLDTNWYPLCGYIIEHPGCPPIPAPGAVVLGGIGVVCIGWLRRRHSL